MERNKKDAREKATTRMRDERQQCPACPLSLCDPYFYGTCSDIDV